MSKDEISVPRELLTSLRDSAALEIDERLLAFGEDYRPHVLKALRADLAAADALLAQPNTCTKDGALAREAALQQRLNEADQRIEEITEELQGAIVEAQDWHHKHQTALCELAKARETESRIKVAIADREFYLQDPELVRGNRERYEREIAWLKCFLVHQSTTPAHAPVVLPGRMGHSTRGNGWNAYDDELKRLNPELFK